ncbi:glycosyltransferase [Candidatus Parcubacteria bacterium]|nr:glycosyltransferase [Patescibacteria group bacterium]MCG2686991.1 glycosyltransferase [Candidatus Parcubacteria bacterium]
MKLIYLTAKTYPSSTADHIFIREMSKASAKILNNNFVLVVANNFSQELDGINIVNLKLKIKKGLTIFYYFFIPYFILKRKLNNIEATFFSVDQNLLKVVIFYKKIFNLKYKIISDWHMLFDIKKNSCIIKNSDGLIATTNHLKNLLVSKFAVPENKIKVAYGGVDLEFFNKNSESQVELRTRLGLPWPDILVGYVGFYKTMGMAKGLDTMIKSLSLIPDKEIKMVFVGGRVKEIEEYKNFAEKKGVADRVIFVPVMSTEKIALYEKAMDMLVIPYPNEPHFRDWGFPMKAYEYMASQKPIIYSDLPIISEMLSNCAISFKAGDANDLAEKILFCKNNQTSGEELANKAYKKVVNYTWDKRAEGIIAFLKGIL